MYKITLIFFIIFLNYSIFSYEQLNNGYKEFKLGMGKSEVEKLLQTSDDFNILKEEILSTRLEPDTEIISTEGTGFIIYGYFHFDKDELFQIFLKIDREKIGYYFLLKKLITKYGNPTKFNPKRAIWENNEVRIILEKPCNIKYINLPIWNEIIKDQKKKDFIMDKLRDDFSNDF